MTIAYRRHGPLRLFTLALLALLDHGASSAQSLKPAQLATVCTACKAASACNTPRTLGDTVGLLEWLNGAAAPAVAAWRHQVQPIEMDQAANYTAFDSLTSGKRAAWPLMLGYTRDFRVNKTRNAITDIWGAATAGTVAESILLAGTSSATNTQVALGGTVKATGTVTATDYSYAGPANQLDADWIVQPANCP
jgi:hypothetical protein